MFFMELIINYGNEIAVVSSAFAGILLYLGVQEAKNMERKPIIIACAFLPFIYHRRYMRRGRAYLSFSSLKAISEGVNRGGVYS